ncbi:MAG: GAF domain-containing protein, partial [Anaerolineae bacterium]|nr:GAF domain-containing protein [Anaerolineae bacterium]
IAREKIRSHLQVIIRSKGTPAGLLVVASRDGREFTAREEQLLSTIAHQIGLAVENVGLYEEQVNKVFQMDALRKTTLDITSQLDLDVLLHSIASRAVQLLNGTAGGLYLYRPEHDVLEWAVAIGDAMAPIGTTLQRGEGLSGNVWETGQPVIVDDYSHWEGRSRQYEGYRFEALVGVPVRWQEKFLGVLNVLEQARRTFSPNDAELLSLFAGQAAIAIENARLYEGAKDRLAELTALQEISLQLTRSLDSADVLDTVASSVLRLFQASDVHIFVYDRENDELSFAAGAWDEPEKSRSPYRAPRKDGLTAQVARSGRPLLVNETRSHPLFVDYEGWRADMEAIGGFPLKAHDRVIGVFNVAFDSPHTFDEHELRLVGLLADQAAIAIQNARLFAEQERRAREMTALYETSLDISGRLALTNVLRSIMNRGVELLHTAGGAVWLYRPAEDELELAIDYGTPETFVGGRMRVGEGVSGKVFADRQAMAVEDYRHWEGRSQKYDSDIIGGMLGVPLMWGEQAIGVLNVNEIGKPRKFTEEEIRLLSLFASQAAVAIQNARLHEETRRREAHLAALHDVALEIASELDLTVLLKTVAQRAIDLLGGPSGGLYLYHPDRQELERVVHLGSGHEYLGTTLRLGEGACGRVAQTGQPLVVVDYANWEGRSVKFEDEGNFNVLAVPIKHGDSLLGALYVNDPDLERRFDEADIRLATMFANQAAIAIENAQLLHAVDKHKESLQELSSRLIDAQEQERKRIAQELHDELGQALTAMSINLSAIDKQLG